MSLEELKKSDNSVNAFSFDGQELHCKVVDVYDADTIKINMILDGNIVKFTCRLIGIDTPEMKPRKNKENRKEEIRKAKDARNYLLELITGIEFDNTKKYMRKQINQILKDNHKLVKIKCGKFDKYGRLLVEVFDIKSQSGGSFNQNLIDKGHAYAYYGGTKRK